MLDDGKIAGEAIAVSPRRILVRITVARSEGVRLAADKGVNLPDTPMTLRALSPRDRQDLDFVARHADLVGFSFARERDDLRDLRRELKRRGATRVGIILKVETARSFENLPHLLLEGLKAPSFGVMIARGDLAVEIGWERLAEVQEEILCLCEAAHTPVVWATQVLESLAKKGLPSRSEITDAAMGHRAECVMLNKGPYVVRAVRALQDILRRMEGHQSKRRQLLRALHVAERFATDA
jgi:pyruvate kinase